MLTLMLGMMMFQAGPTPPPDAVVAQYEERTYEVPSADPPRTLRYRLLKPANVEAGKKYPVVLYLHGAGERGDDNKLQLLYFPEWMTRPEWREKYPCYVIAPQCPTGKYWAGLRLAKDAPVPASPPPSEAELTYGVLQSLIGQLPIDTKRIYLTGLSMGGYGSWALAASHPETFAAVVPICGGGDVTTAPRLKDVPLWAVHGGADRVVLPERSREMIAAVKAAGGTPGYTELEGVGHDSWTPAYNDPAGVLPWMFEQHK